jgi:hypothetical protein
MTVVILAVVLGIAAAAYGTSCCPSHAGGVEEKAKAEEAEMMEMPFGGEKDVAFAEALWAAMDGYDGWMMQSDIMPGKSPHGMFVRLYYSIVNVDGMPYHVVVKDNYGGEGVTLEMVKESPAEYLMAVTPMLQREEGYDPDNKDWFWVKFSPDGSIDKTDKDVAIAGRFAKGMPMGCIACHANAGGGDYLFAND